MHRFADLYRPSLALVTDLYELTMAYGYWKSGMAGREAVFCLGFRRNPFGAGATVACGLEPAAEFLEAIRFDPDDLDYLATLKTADGSPLFERGFFDFLADFCWNCDLDAVPEGTVVFPHEPLLRVRGPLVAAQVVESALLNLVNFQTLVATKAARVVAAASGEPVLEFGLRRAQGFDGALSASRAAYVGGCAATSNVLAGRLYGIPVQGTHAHSWVMCFDDEPAAFQAYAEAMPSNCTFLVDTYDTLDGVRHAIEVGRALRRRGYAMRGIRLDSGDLAQLSIDARRMLDEAGFTDAAIVGSGDLDEHAIAALKRQGAPIGIWGVGTRLATGHPDGALGGVYKLSAVQDADGRWHDRVKLSEEPSKSSLPGMLQVRRFCPGGRAAGDVIYDDRRPPDGAWTMHDMLGGERETVFSAETPSEDLLVPVFRGGRRVIELPSLAEIRRRVTEQWATFDDSITRLDAPAEYPVGLELSLARHREELVRRANVEGRS